MSDLGQEEDALITRAMEAGDKVFLAEITKRTKALKDALETLSAYGHGAEARRIKNTYDINFGE